MTTDFQTKISNLYLNTKTITGTLSSVETFLATAGTAEDIASFYTALEAEVGALSQKKAQAAGQNILSAVGIEDILNNPVAEVNASDIQGDIIASQVYGPLTRATIEASQITGLIINEDIVSIAASKVAGLADVATSGEYSDLLNKPNLVAIAPDGTVDAEQVVGSLTNAYIAASRVDGTVAEANHAASADSAESLTGTINGTQVSGSVAEANHAASADSADSLTGTINGTQVSGSVAEANHAASADSFSGTIDGNQITGALGSDVTIDGTQITGLILNTAIIDLEGSRLAGNITDATIHLANVEFSDGKYYLGSYVTDNRGFQIGTTDTAVALKVVDAKIGQIDTVVIKDGTGTIVGQETTDNMFIVADMLQALENKLGYDIDITYPISNYITNMPVYSSNIVGDIDASLISGSLINANIDASNVNGLAAVATGGSIDASLVSGSLTNANIDASHVNNLAAVATGGSLAASLVSGSLTNANIDASNVNGLADVATGGNLDGSLVSGSLTNANIDASNVNDLAAVATGGSLAASLVSGSLTNANIDASNVNGLAAVATGGNLDGSLVSGSLTNANIDASRVNDLAGVATGGSLAASLVSGSLTDATIDASQITGDVCSNCIDASAFTGSILGVGVYDYSTGCGSLKFTIPSIASPSTMDFLITSVLCETANYGTTNDGVSTGGAAFMSLTGGGCVQYADGTSIGALVGACQYYAFHLTEVSN